MVTIARPPCDEGVIRSRPCAAAVPARQGRWILAATILRAVPYLLTRAQEAFTPMDA